MPLIKGKSPASMSHNISEEMHAGKPKSPGISIAYNLARKTAAKKMAQGGMAGSQCHACGGMMSQGGMMNEQESATLGDQGSYEEGMNFEHGYSEGGGVDEQYSPHSINDTDGDDDDLVYSPEVGSAEGDNEEDAGDEEGKRNNFLRSYLIQKKLRRG